jgi:hypothetical protein
MIIWGSKGKADCIQRGQFFCPRCASLQSYEWIRVRKYFTLYFIPLFSTDTLGEYVECKGCLTPFRPEVLEYSPAAGHPSGPGPAGQALLDAIARDLESGISLQAMAVTLTRTGMSEQGAAAALFVATEGRVKTCPRCGVSFKASLRFCSTCGGPLDLPAQGP